MSKNPLIERALDIIKATHDGDNLSGMHLYMVECACNGLLKERGVEMFHELHANVMKSEGYTHPWFYGIENLIHDQNSWVLWRGERVEHFTFGDKLDEQKLAAERLARFCRQREGQGHQVADTDFMRGYFTFEREDSSA